MVQNLVFTVGGQGTVVGHFNNEPVRIFCQGSKSGGVIRFTCGRKEINNIESGIYPIAIQLIVRAGESGSAKMTNNGKTIWSMSGGMRLRSDPSQPSLVTGDRNVREFGVAEQIFIEPIPEIVTIDPTIDPQIDIFQPELETISDNFEPNPDPVPETNIVPVEAGVINDQDVNFENSFIETELGRAEEIGIDDQERVSIDQMLQPKQQEQKSDIKNLLLPLAALFFASGG